MDFFARQAEVRRSSRLLVALFVLAVLAIVAAVDGVCVLFFGLGPRPQPLLMISALVLLVIGGSAAYRIASLAGGGAAVAASLGATEVTAGPGDPRWRLLRNVVEEIAIAAGVPVPDIYVMTDEPAINAFAAGYSPSDAVVCVTQGCLDQLNRDELQGVIAHEFSHVLNGDMRLNIRLLGLLFGIMALWVIGRFLLGSGGYGRSSRGRGQVALLGLALLAIGAIGVLFGRLIQASVARRRESLADASAVQFTRQTAGIAGALKKIAALGVGSTLQSARRDEMRHMLFGEATASAWFATHPPILERIRALEPGFQARELDAYVKRWLAAGGNPDALDPREGLPATTAPALGAVLPAAGGVRALGAAAVLTQVAAVALDAPRTARPLATQIPAPLQTAARDARGALAVVLALALAADADTRARQLQAINETFDAALGAATQNLASDAAGLHPLLRLPLAQLAFPALKRRPRPQLERFVQTLDALIHADGQVELNEYCLAKLVQVQVTAALDPAASFKPGKLKLAEARDELRDLVALLARFGSGDDDDAARRAFQAAMHEAFPNTAILYAQPEDWPAALDRALAVLPRLGPAGKQLTIAALTRAIASDGTATLAETELLRVVCAALACPLPAGLGMH